MSYLIQKKYVRYECDCGSLKPITELYFCRHCLELRCTYCVSHEVDSHYCSNCLEHLPSSEAKFRKNRCNTCMDCPSCGHTLGIKATGGRGGGAGGGEEEQSKRYYLACMFCRWTTRESGIPDQSTATGNWPVKEQSYLETLSSYLEHYKILAIREKTQREKRPQGTPFFKGYSSFTDKYGLTAMMARKRAGLPPLPLHKESSQASLPKISPSVAVEELEPLPDNYFTDVTKVTTVEQRHAYPMLQADTVSGLHPQARHFYVKCSLRCRKCEHNVSKPEFNPGSIKFKIQLAAFYHMPEIRIMSFEPLRAGISSEIILKITNPTQRLTSLQFLPYNPELSLKPALTRNDSTEKKDKAFSVVTQLPRPPRAVQVNMVVALPDCSVVLPPRDDAADYDDSSESHKFDDDTKVIIWRKGNQVGVKMKITPDRELGSGAECTFAFTMEYSYVNTIPTLEPAKGGPQRAEIQVNVFLSPGSLLLDQTTSTTEIHH